MYNMLVLMGVVFLIILIISIIYFFNNRNYQTEEQRQLNMINKAILKNSEYQKPEFTEFEKEQEENAVISYSELKTKTSHFKEEEYEETITQKPVSSYNVDNNYSSEENFLMELKSLGK